MKSMFYIISLITIITLSVCLWYSRIQLTHANWDITYYKQQLYGIKTEKPKYINKCFIDRTFTILLEFNKDKTDSGYDVYHYIEVKDETNKLFYYKLKNSWVRYGYLHINKVINDHHLEVKCPSSNEILK